MCSPESASCLCFAPEDFDGAFLDTQVPPMPRALAPTPQGADVPIRLLIKGDRLCLGDPYDEHEELEITGRGDGALTYTRWYILPAGDCIEKCGSGELPLSDAPVSTLGSPGEVSLAR